MADIFQKAFSEQINRIIEKYKDVDDSFDDVINMVPEGSEDSEESSKSEERKDQRPFDIFYMSGERRRGIKSQGFDFMNNRLGFIEIYESIFGNEEFSVIYERVNRRGT